MFFRGRPGEDGKVGDLLVLARGNEDAVPAPESAVSAGDVVIHNHPTGILVPSSADLEVASRLGALGAGFFIVDNDARRVYAVVEPAAPAAPAPPVSPEEVERFFAAGGSLASVLPEYEARAPQAAMARAVAAMLDSGRVGVFEAGTGTGKSLAYLLPAVLWCLAGGRRVVVATNTIPLQEQQLRKDLPLLARALGGDKPFRAALVKGRGNYLCLRKRSLIDAEDGETLLDFAELAEVQALLAWSKTTSEGSLSDLPFVPKDGNWELFRSEGDSCLRSRCPHLSRCFFHRARREAASAQILLANHHLLFADLSLREAGEEAAAILPKYDAVVLDEAHNVEEVALSYFDQGLSRWGALSLLGRLVSRRKADRGLVPLLVSRLSSARLGDEARTALLDDAWALARAVPEERATAESLLDTLADALGDWLGEGRSRIPAARRRGREWEEAAGLLQTLAECLRRVLGPVRRLTRRLREAVDEGADELAAPWGDLSGVGTRLEGAVLLLDRMRDEANGAEGEDEVFWVEVKRKGPRPSVALHLTPLDTAGMMEGTLFNRRLPVILTSATLTVAGSFSFLAGRLGIDRLEEGRVREEVFPSPFDLPRQMTLSVLDDLPEPEGNNAPTGLGEAVGRMTSASGGGALVLFTSYRTLDRVWDDCEPLFAGMGLTALRQGEAPRTVLLERFRSDLDSVLFATDSFWEGIDVMGEALRLVVITRLPFDVPTDPVMEARREAFLREGRDPFMEDAVPRAVIRFRQGVGRLLRHRDDRGCVVVCDRRVLRRSYGRLFLASLPGVTPRVAGTGATERHLREFLRRV